MYSRSDATSPYDGSSRRRVEYTCNESFTSRTKFSGLTGGNSTELPAHQLSLLGFGEVGDSRSLKGQLLKGPVSDMMYDCLSKREDRGDRKGEMSQCRDYTGSVLTLSQEPRQRSGWLAASWLRSHVSWEGVYNRVL
jgi:hypothetical protein